MDRKIGRVGAAADMESEEVARAEALAQCKKNAAANCVVDVAYVNACVAIGWPSDGGIVVEYVEKDIPKAKASALKECSQTNNGACEVTYVECSLPVFERF
jgi:hypothetical protein